MRNVDPRIRRLGGYAVVGVTAFALGAVIFGPASEPPTEQSVLDEAAQRIQEGALTEVTQEQLEQGAVEGMLSVLDDPHSVYYPKSDSGAFSGAMEGRYTGVGLWLKQTLDGVVEIASVQPGSPAAAAGVRAGDTLVSVDDVTLDGAGLTVASQTLRGEPGTTVSIRLLAEDELRSVTLTRSEVPLDDVTVESLSGGALRIRVGSFTTGVGRQVRQALAATADGHPAGVILDLRDDPGGLLDEAVEVAGAFLDGGAVVSYTSRGQGEVTLTAPPGGDTTTPLVVLVNGATASAAEVVTGALQDRGRAVVVGSTTYGKGSVQEPVRLHDGSVFEITVGSYTTPSGRSLERVGIEPDIRVDASAGPRAAERRALQVLTGLQAALTPVTRG